MDQALGDGTLVEGFEAIRLDDPSFVFWCCDASSSGRLDKDALKYAFRAFGLEPSSAVLAEYMKRQCSVDKQGFLDMLRELSESLPMCMRCTKTVPHALRGMTLGQLEQVEQIFLTSGWLRDQCETFNL